MTSTLPPLVQAFSGAIGSATANGLTYPLDLVATRLQLESSDDSEGGIHRAIRILRHIIKKYGLDALYDGIWTDSSATLLSNFFYFYFYSFLRSSSTNGLISASFKKLTKNGSTHTHKPSMLEELVLGFLAGVASRALSMPLNIITLRLQTERDSEDETLDSTKEVGLLSAVKLVYKEQGLRGFWKGFQTTTILSLNPSITLALFQLFRRVLTLARSHKWNAVNRILNNSKTVNANLTPGEAFFGGAVSNSIAIAILYPLILAKTRLQASSTNSMTQVLADAYNGKSNSFKSRQKTGEGSNENSEGDIRRLYQGLEMQIIKGFLSQGVTFLVKGRIEQMIINAYLRRRSMRHSLAT